jgi:hypothetical protein
MILQLLKEMQRDWLIKKKHVFYQFILGFHFVSASGILHFEMLKPLYNYLTPLEIVMCTTVLIYCIASNLRRTWNKAKTTTFARSYSSVVELSEPEFFNF